jgi:hypothetical protein
MLPNSVGGPLNVSPEAGRTACVPGEPLTLRYFEYHKCVVRRNRRSRRVTRAKNDDLVWFDRFARWRFEFHTVVAATEKEAGGRRSVYRRSTELLTTALMMHVAALINTLRMQTTGVTSW